MCEVIETENGVELELSISWARDNGELFAMYFNKFFEEYAAPNWQIKSRARKGYIVLVAEKPQVVTTAEQFKSLPPGHYVITGEAAIEFARQAAKVFEKGK